MQRLQLSDAALKLLERRRLVSSREIKMAGEFPRHIRRNPLYRSFWNRLHYRNSNLIAAFYGLPGSGKSYSALRWAWDLDRDVNGEPRFSVDKVAFTRHEFLQLLRQRLPKGSCIVWEELGVGEGINARKFWREENQKISYVIQTFRFQNLATFFTVPAKAYVDIQVRQLVHLTVEMAGVDEVNRVALGKVKWSHLDALSGKVFSKFARLWGPAVAQSGHFYNNKVRFVRFVMPPKDLVKAYEERMKEHKERWQLDAIENELEELRRRQREESPWGKAKLKDFVDYVVKHKELFWSERLKRFDPSLVLYRHPGNRFLSYSKASVVCRAATAELEGNQPVVQKTNK